MNPTKSLFRSLLALAPLAAVTHAQSPYQVGEPLPALRLPELEGETLDLAQFRGRKLVLFEFASW